VFLKQWIKSRYGYFFRLSNDVFQLDFVDGTKVVIAHQRKQVLFFDKSNKQAKYRLDGYIDPQVEERMAFAQEVLKQCFHYKQASI